MAILCCCSQFRSRKRIQNEGYADLPVPPPPAKLPPPVLHPSATSPGSTLARSSLTNPLPGAATDASVHLGELVVEESDDDDDEDPVQDSRNRSTSTLLAVKSRIRRHLSQDSLQRQSETEEQIAHRAEVKRLMRKRIQEELQSEADNIPSRSSTPQRHVPGPATLPGNGPRDTIEFTVDENHKSRELAPITADHVMETDEEEGHLHGSTFHDASSLASWRLSLSADKLADLFTPDKSLTLFRPLANTPATCSTADLREGASLVRPRIGFLLRSLCSPSPPYRKGISGLKLPSFKLEERFRNSHLRKGSLNPVESKFREIFDHDGDPGPNNRISLLSKLHFNVPKRAKVAIIETLDGSISGHALAGMHASPPSELHNKTSMQASLDNEHLQVPVIVHRKSTAKATGIGQTPVIIHGRSRRLRGFSSSKDGDDAAELWKRAVRAESESRSPRGSTSSNVPAICLSPAISDHGKVPKAPQPSGAGSLSSSRSDVHSPLCKVHPDLSGEAAVREALRRSTTILEHWVHRIESQEREAQEQGKNCASVPFSHYKEMKMPPASWAKFPSYNREERNASAGGDDNIKSKDFAVRNISASGNIIWATDKMGNHPSSQKGIARTFSDKFSQTFKSRLSKLIPGRSRTPSRDRSIRGERRSSIQMAGDLEYPELEILSTAGGYRELRALEAEIHEMKGIVDTKTQSTQNDFAAPPLRPSLAEKMATAMQQHHGCSDPDLSQASDAASCVAEKASIVQIRSPETPTLQVRYPEATRAKESTGSTVERYATPLSHLSLAGNETSRSGSPDIINKMLPSADSPNSVNSAKSLTRRASVRAVPNVEASILGPHIWQKPR
ncbi:hypothetical protein J7T55_006604 [Diaporthe amygdali]|uniref:uncharacterized protein n=1 Tax=Phomopsis amygdali TaxID=1214568 RepID=UPI0022FF1E42|nr:uncharacterized protein J7T55_006604 [Diaporthe amygdali]KAJ0125259.1 hypothetical protein J7T55_006604 [Diaporthe amygdali]